MSLSGIQSTPWLQPASPAMVPTARDGQAGGAEAVSFLEELEASVRTPAATGDRAASESIVTKPTVPAAGTIGTIPVREGGTVGEGPGTTATNWKDFVFGKSTSGNYAGVMAAPTRELDAGYRPGQYRGQLEGFNQDKFDPAHPEGMTLKMIAGRIFEQFDVYSDTAIDDVVRAFNEAGIPATRVGLDQIDFNNGEGPIDVIRNAAWLDGDTSAGMAWQWAPTIDGAQPMNFTMIGGPAAPLAGLTPATGGVGAVEGAGGTQPVSGVNPGTGLYPGAMDQLDLSAVRWLHANVASWPVTSQITDVQVGSDSITIDHTKSGHWPSMNYSGVQVEGNPWVFVNRGGMWYGATYEWLRPGQTEKGVTAEGIGANIKVEPLASWQPDPIFPYARRSRRTFAGTPAAMA